MITAYSKGSPMLKAYIDLNGIKSAFVFKEGERVWQVYAGDAAKLIGYKEGEPFRTKRDALEHASKVNALIESVEATRAATFDRFDICEAHYILESDYNVGGILRERPSNQRRNMSSGFQLSRMGFKPSPNLSFETLSENGQELYKVLVKRYQLPE